MDTTTKDDGIIYSVCIEIFICLIIVLLIYTTSLAMTNGTLQLTLAIWFVCIIVIWLTIIIFILFKDRN